MTFNALGLGRHLFRRGRQIARGGLRQLPGASLAPFMRKTKRTTGRKPKTLQVNRQSKGNNWYPRFNITPFQKAKHSVLKYTERAQLTGGLSGIAGGTLQIAMNGLFDPTLGGGGHQPMGFDEMTNIWRRYKVYKVEFKVRTISTAGNPWVAAMVSTSQAPSTMVSGSTYADLNERSNCATTIVRQEDDSIMYGEFQIADIEGQSLDDDNYSGGVNGNPSNVPKLTVAIGDIGGGDTVGANIIVEITYFSWFYNREIMGQS